MMKKAATKVIACFLLSVIFIFSTGFTVFTNICSISNHKQIGIENIKSCCEENFPHDPVITLKSKCCETDHQFLKFDFTAIQQYDIHYFPVNYISFSTIADIVLINIEITALSFHIDLPPPDKGRDILIQNQVFLI